MAESDVTRTTTSGDNTTVWVIRGGESILAEFPEEARLVGVMMGEWSAIEHNLVMLLSFSLSADAKIVFPMAYAVVANRARLDVVFAALGQIITGPGDIGDLAALAKEAGEVLSLRNTYAHSVYAKDEKGLIAIDMGKLVKGTPGTHVEVDRLRKVVERMLTLKLAINTFIGKRPWTRQL